MNVRFDGPSRHRLRSIAFMLSLPILAACQGTQDSGESIDTASSSTMTDSIDAQSQWTSLFDGATLNGWQGHGTPGVTPPGWSVENGTLVRSDSGGDLVTVDQYANFELEFEWMVGSAGNSGVFYRINPDVERTYMSAPEYQVLDDSLHADGKSRLTSAGAVYGLYPSPEGHTRPTGEWNQGRIVVDGAKVEHWLNGTLMAAYELWSPDWEQRVKDSKFNEWPSYGRATRGHIGVQDHGDRVAYRNIRIKVLP